MKVAMWLGGVADSSVRMSAIVRPLPPPGDPQTTRHKAERHEEVRAHEDANSDTWLRTHVS